jgi:hypothetical protein
MKLMDISRFIKVYAELPPRLKEQIVVVIDDAPMTWNAAYRELRSESKLSKRILEKLIEMEVI